MSDLIQWPTAKYWTAQWNPIIGCKPCSPACENCYAAAWARRFGQSFEPHESSRVRPPRKGVVGTAGEQQARFNAYVREHWSGKTTFQWAQMPYNEKGGAE